MSIPDIDSIDIYLSIPEIDSIDIDITCEVEMCSPSKPIKNTTFGKKTK